MKIKIMGFYLIEAIFCICLTAIPLLLMAESNQRLSSPSFNILKLNYLNKDIYQQVLDQMEFEYEKIGKEEALKILNGNLVEANLGLNQIGFSYKKAFVDFSINANRSLAPDLYDDHRWIVTDQFSLYIDASLFLKNLKHKKIIEISEKSLNLFLGMVFKRTYTWVHFANSYQEGLSTEFQKLFLPFNAFLYFNLKELDAHEIVSMEDSIALNAGEFLFYPVAYGVAAKMAGINQFIKLSKVEMISFPANESNEQKDEDEIHLSLEKTQLKTNGIGVELAADFFKILKLTLFSYQINYELSSSYKLYLKVLNKNLDQLMDHQTVWPEFMKILKNQDADRNILSPYIISEEKRIAETIQHKYSMLLLGGTKNSNTEQVEIVSGTKSESFFRHYFEKIKYSEKFISKIFNGLLSRLLDLDIGALKAASSRKKLTIEYKSTKNLIGNKELLNVKALGEILSMTFSNDFKGINDTGMLGKKIYQRVLFLTDHFTPSSLDLSLMIRKNELVAPFEISLNHQINLAGIMHLNSLGTEKILDHINDLCQEYPRNKFFNFRNLFDHCRKSLQNNYFSYLINLSHQKINIEMINACQVKARNFLLRPFIARTYVKDCLAKISFINSENRNDIPLWELKNLSDNILNASFSKNHYDHFFGHENIFFYGSFSAKTKNGQAFMTYFKDGVLKNFGAIDHYLKSENLRANAVVAME